MQKVYVGDKGTDIILSTGIDVTGADLSIIVSRPDGTQVVWEATQAGGDGVRYTTSMGESDWTILGRWRLQAHIAFGTWAGAGDTMTVQVFALGQ
jgi:hypothetical protein